MAMALDQARAQHEEEAAILEADVRRGDREIAQLQAEIKAVATDAATNGRAAARLAELHDRLRAAEDRAGALREKIDIAARQAITKAEVDSVLKAFDPLWATLSPKEQAQMLRLLIARVEFDGASGKVSVTFRANGLQTRGQHSARITKEDRACQTE